MSKVNLKKIAKKFYFNFIEETINKEEVEISEFCRLNSLTNRDVKNSGVVIELNEEIGKELEKISIIIISNKKKLNKDQIKKLKEYKKPIFYSSFPKRELISSLELYIIKRQQDPERLHATMLTVFGEGIAIIGKSGIGKSELALELINKNHLFIGDDAIDVISFAGQVLAKAPSMSRDFIEVRGVGIINAKDMFGVQSIVKQHSLDLIIELVNLNDVISSIDRLGNNYEKMKICNVEIPKLQVPVSSGRSLAPVVEAAVISFKQRKYNNYIAANDLSERIKEKLKT